MIVIDWYQEGKIFAGIDTEDLTSKDELTDMMKLYVEAYEGAPEDTRGYCEEEDFYIFRMEPVELIHYMGSRDALNFIIGA